MSGKVSGNGGDAEGTVSVTGKRIRKSGNQDAEDNMEEKLVGCAAVAVLLHSRMRHICPVGKNTF